MQRQAYLKVLAEHLAKEGQRISNELGVSSRRQLLQFAALMEAETNIGK